MSPHLKEYAREVEDARSRAERLARSLDHDQFNWQPDSRSWSVAQCLEHLNIFGTEKIVPAIDEMIAEAESRGLDGDGAFRHGLFGGWLIRRIDAPAGMKMKTATDLVPPSKLDKREVMRTFHSVQDDLVERSQRAAGLDLTASKRRLPIPVWLNLGEWFAFAVAHERRHLEQAARVVGHEAFPGAPAELAGQRV